MVEDGRVDGDLAVSWSIGDFFYKDKQNLSAAEQAVTALPDITETSRN